MLSWIAAASLAVSTCSYKVAATEDDDATGTQSISLDE